MITTKLKDFREAVSIVAHTTPTRTTLSALNAVRISIQDDVLAAMASDIRSFAKSHCGASGNVSDAFGVDAGRLIHFLSFCTAEDLTIEVNERAVLKCGSLETTMGVVSSGEFPEFPKVKGTFFEINANELLEKLTKVIPSAEDDETSTELPVFCAVLFEFTPDGLILTATNGRQLSTCSILIYGNGSFVVPRRLIQALLKMLPSVEGDVLVTANDKAIEFSAQRWTLTGSLINGEFPPWRSVISDNEKRIEVAREPLLDAIKSALPYGEAGFTRLMISTKDDKLTIESGSQDFMKSVIDAKADDIELAVDAKRLLGVLSALREEKVTLSVDERPGHQIVVREGYFTGVIMPLRK